jgi:hypothetical protein
LAITLLKLLLPRADRQTMQTHRRRLRFVAVVFVVGLVGSAGPASAHVDVSRSRLQIMVSRSFEPGYPAEYDEYGFEEYSGMKDSVLVELALRLTKQVPARVASAKVRCTVRTSVTYADGTSFTGSHTRTMIVKRRWLNAQPHYDWLRVPLTYDDPVPVWKAKLKHCHVLWVWVYA